MDHEQIDQLNLIDRYLMGKLLADESAGFEEHFVDCPRCIARLQTTKNFMQDLRLAAVEQAAHTAPRAPRNGWRGAVKTFLPKPLAWVGVCMLIAAAGGAFFVIDYTRRLRDEANQATRRAEQGQRRYEDERQAAAAADQLHREAEAQQNEQLRALAAKLKAEEARRAEMAAASRRLPSAGNLPLFALASVRSGESNPAESMNRVILPRAAAIFALSVALEGETPYEAYRITILDEGRRPILKRDRLSPGSHDALTVWLQPGLFRPGHYMMVVEGDRSGGSSVVGNYPFLIIKTR